MRNRDLRKSIFSIIDCPCFLCSQRILLCLRGKRIASRGQRAQVGVPKLPLRQRYGSNADVVCRTNGRGLASNLAEFNGCHLRGQGTHTELSHRNVSLLHYILHRVSILLRQHIRGLDYHHLPGAGRSRASGWGNRQKSSKYIDKELSKMKQIKCVRY